ncbi:MAG: ABC transporter permease [Alphaproteobacteria bacterium]|jgi:tungstate transport system permease protein|nr:ABC transporter permease [Alphaproteobacteria bacterium]
MQQFGDAFAAALGLIVSADSGLGEIVALSLRVSGSAVVLALLLGLPLGALLALYRFPGRGVAIVGVNALMGLPPVVVGLVVYLMFSRSGPLGVFGLLYSPSAMIIAQLALVLPIIAALSRQHIEDLWGEYGDQLRSFGSSRWRAVPTLLWEGRISLLTVVLAGFGRAIAEVGAVMIVGGNIDHYTRVMTTAISLETSKGDLPLALGLGVVLLLLSLAVNTGLTLARATTVRQAG